jgi:hypothetical protein
VVVLQKLARWVTDRRLETAAWPRSISTASPHTQPWRSDLNIGRIWFRLGGSVCTSENFPFCVFYVKLNWFMWNSYVISVKFKVPNRPGERKSRIVGRCGNRDRTCRATSWKWTPLLLAVSWAPQPWGHPNATSCTEAPSSGYGI